MNILQINAVNGISSTGSLTYEIARELKKQGHNSYIAFSNTNCIYEDGYKIGNKIDVKIHGLMSRISGLQGYFSYLATKKLIKFIKEKNTYQVLF